MIPNPEKLLTIYNLIKERLDFQDTFRIQNESRSGLTGNKISHSELCITN